jgi:SAM-dependent methyltransferase
MLHDGPRENVFGHAKKLELIQAALAGLRKSRGFVSVLDVGCGNGTALTRHVALVADAVLGIDLHEPSIKYAQQHLERPGLRFSNTPIERVDGVYDAVIFSDVLEHVPTPDAFLALARRLVTPDGRVLVTIPNGYGPFEWESAFSRLPFLGHASIRLTDTVVAVLNKFVFRDRWASVVADPSIPYNDDSGHVQFFTRRRFLRIVETAGFKVGDAHNLSFLCGPYTNYFMAPSERFCRANTWLADRLPAGAVSAWFFELRRA